VTSHSQRPDSRASRVTALRGDLAHPPHGSIIIPVNAQADLERVLTVVDDLLAYRGQHRFELVLMVNNYPASAPPPITTLVAAQLCVVCLPNVRVPGVRVAIAARVHGARAAAAPLTIHIDADCRVPDPTALLDWYVAQFAGGARAAYTPVGFCDLSGDWSTRARIAAHTLARWAKRRLLGVPTIRGSNFAIERTLLLDLFAAGYLPADFSLGPVLRARGEPVAYSGAARLHVLTSGRYFERGWRELARYLRYRLGYNLAMLRVRAGAGNPDDQQANTGRPYPIHRDDEALAPNLGGEPGQSVAEKRPA
jgi:hypothetical protein